MNIERLAELRNQKSLHERDITEQTVKVIEAIAEQAKAHESLVQQGKLAGTNWETRATYAQLLKVKTLPIAWTSDWTALTTHFGLNESDTGLGSRIGLDHDQLFYYFSGFIHAVKRTLFLVSPYEKDF